MPWRGDVLSAQRADGNANIRCRMTSGRASAPFSKNAALNCRTQIDADLVRSKLERLKEARARLAGHQEQLNASGKDQLSLTDPDAMAMSPSSNTGVGYNAQVAVDTKYSLIVEQQIHCKVSDLGLLTQTAEAAKDTLGVEQIDVVADRGFYKIEDIADCEAAGLVPHVPQTNRGPAQANGLFTKSNFEYHPDIDRYICPGGGELKPILKAKTRDDPETGYASMSACRACSLKSK